MVNVVFNHLKSFTFTKQITGTTLKAVNRISFGFLRTILERSCFGHLTLSVCVTTALILFWKLCNSCSHANKQRAGVHTLFLHDYVSLAVENTSGKIRLWTENCWQIHASSECPRLQCQLDVLSEERLLFITAKVAVHAPSLYD